jgi:hypothetical protein
MDGFFAKPGPEKIKNLDWIFLREKSPPLKYFSEWSIPHPPGRKRRVVPTIPVRLFFRRGLSLTLQHRLTPDTFTRCLLCLITLVL